MQDDDAPLYEPGAWRLSAQEADLCALARRLGRERFAARAATYDVEARFPTENYRDLREHGLLAVCVPRAAGG